MTQTSHGSVARVVENVAEVNYKTACFVVEKIINQSRVHQSCKSCAQIHSASEIKTTEYSHSKIADGLLPKTLLPLTLVLSRVLDKSQ